MNGPTRSAGRGLRRVSDIRQEGADGRDAQLRNSLRQGRGEPTSEAPGLPKHAGGGLGTAPRLYSRLPGELRCRHHQADGERRAGGAVSA